MTTRNEILHRQKEAFLRLRSRGHEHLENRLRLLFDVTLASRYRPQYLLAVGGRSVVVAAEDAATPAVPFVAVKFPFFDWTRPGKTSTAEISAIRNEFIVEGELLRRANGDILPAYIESFGHNNPLIKEPEPRIAPGERFLVMEWIDASPVDAAARKVAKARGRESQAFTSWTVRTLQRISGALIRLHALFPGLIYTDVAPKNFLLPEAKDVRVVDAGSLISRKKRLCQAPFTPEYCPLSDREKEKPATERAVTSRLGMLGLDLLSDRISLRASPEDVLAELRGYCPLKVVDLLTLTIEGEFSSLEQFIQSLSECDPGGPPDET